MLRTLFIHIIKSSRNLAVTFIFMPLQVEKLAYAKPLLVSTKVFGKIYYLSLHFLHLSVVNTR